MKRIKLFLIGFLFACDHAATKNIGKFNEGIDGDGITYDVVWCVQCGATRNEATLILAGGATNSRKTKWREPINRTNPE
jgi:hypothetical protein